MYEITDIQMLLTFNYHFHVAQQPNIKPKRKNKINNTTCSW